MDEENVRIGHEEDASCVCGDNVFREGVHLPGCPLHKEQGKQKERPTIAELEAAIGTPNEMDILPDGSLQPKHVQPRRDEELRETVAVVDLAIIGSALDIPPRLFVCLPAIRDALKELIQTRSKRHPECVGSIDFKEDCFALRAQIEETKIQTMLVFKEHPVFSDDPEKIGYTHPAADALSIEQYNEMQANLKLAYRHLEDARMRCGKAIQAFEGGKSCYPR